MTDRVGSVDARLLIPAAAAWAGAFVARGALAQVASATARHAVATGWTVGTLTGLAAALLVAAVAVRRGMTSRVAPAILVATVFGILGALAAAISGRALTAPPLAGWIDARATAVVHGVVTTEARTRTLGSAPVWQAAQVVEARLATDLVQARGQRLATEVSLILRLPAGAAVPPPGSRVRLSGRLAPPGQPSDAAATFTVRDVVTLAPPGPLDAAAQEMRTGLRRALADADPDAGSLVAGLAVGDDTSAPAELVADMRRTGLSHLTAVSGGNVAIILAVVLAALGVLRAPVGIRAVGALAALGCFVVLVGPQPSVVRAAAMGALAVGGLVVGGRRAGPSILGAGVVLLVLTMPWLATSWAFALSAFATAGIILLAGPLADRLACWPPAAALPQVVREALSLTAAAQVATWPLLVAMGGAVGWVALPANLVVMPVVAPITVLGLAAAALAPVSTGLAAGVATVATWPAAWIATVAHAGARLPALQPPWPAGWWGIGAVAVTAGGVLVLVRAWPQVPGGARRAGGLALAVVVVIGVVAPPSRRAWPPVDWFLIMCDVGQGDALLVRAGATAAVVVDTGPEPEAIDRCLGDAGVDTVPAVVLTHYHADHVGGLSGVFRHRAVAAVLATPIRDPVDQAVSVDRIVSAFGLSVTPVTAGDTRIVADVGWRAVWPRRMIDAGSVPNNASIVLMVTVDGRHVLLTGDVEPEAQAAIAPDIAAVTWDVVKVPHHGSRFQSPSLTAWAPAPVALVSVGAGNDYGHPAPETIAAWERLGAVVARTDRDGDVAVVSVGERVGVVVRDGPPVTAPLSGMLPPS